MTGYQALAGFIIQVDGWTQGGFKAASNQGLMNESRFFTE
jgi:hypothetical protein